MKQYDFINANIGKEVLISSVESLDRRIKDLKRRGTRFFIVKIARSGLVVLEGIEQTYVKTMAKNQHGLFVPTLFPGKVKKHCLAMSSGSLRLANEELFLTIEEGE